VRTAEARRARVAFKRAIGCAIPGGAVEGARVHSRGSCRRRELITDPAAVLGALAAVELVDEVPELVLGAGGDHRQQGELGIRPEEGQPAEDDAHATGPDVLGDDGRERVTRPGRAVRTLQVGVLDERHRCVRAAERRAVLLDSREQRCRCGARRRSRSLVSGANLTCRDQRRRQNGGGSENESESASTANATSSP
jgi:hypothetical protein